MSRLTQSHDLFDELLLLPTGAASVKNDLLTFIWFGLVDLESIDYTLDVMPRIKEKYGSISSTVLVAEGSVVPNRQQRQLFAEMWQKVQPRGVATYVEASGFISIAVKSVMSAISALSRERDTFRTFGSLNDTAIWLSSRCSLTPGQIISVLNAMPRGPQTP